MQRKWRKFLLSIRGSLSSRHLLLQFLVQTIKEIKARKVPILSSPSLAPPSTLACGETGFARTRGGFVG
jgi:hypothetical protein